MSEDLRAPMESLAARLIELETERAVLDLLYRYGHSIDYGDDEGWLDCFVEEGVYDVQRRQVDTQFARAAVASGQSWLHGEGEVHEKGIRFAGPVARRSFVETHTAAPEAYHKHFLVAPRISLAAGKTSATVQSYFARLDEVNGERVIRSFGRYIDEVVLCSDDKWRFQRRVVEIESLTPDQIGG